MTTRFVLVTGATGQQGMAVSKALLERGHRVRALVRDMSSESGKTLEGMGAELVVADNDDPRSLERAASGVDSVFAMATPALGVDVEVRHGIAIADAAVVVGVQHLVYSSMANADQQTQIPHADSKYKVEQHIKGLAIPWTVVAPVYFMENVLFPWNLNDLKEGVFRQALPPKRALKMTSSQDVGRFVALVIEKREPFIGRRIDIGSDELTGEEMADTLAKSIGYPIEYVVQPIEELSAQFPDAGVMYEWFDRVGYTADIEGLRRDFPEAGWTSFAQWALTQDWSSLGVTPATTASENG